MNNSCTRGATMRQTTKQGCFTGEVFRCQGLLCVSRILRRFQQTSRYCRRAGRGCRWSSTHQQDHYLLYSVQGGTGWALPELLNDPQTTGVSVSDQNQKQTEGPTSSGGLCAHCPVLCSPTAINQVPESTDGAFYRWKQGDQNVM